MRYLETFLRPVFLSLALMFGMVALASPAFAADPDPSINPVLANYLKLGARLFYLGNRSGLDGWFVIKGGQVQVAYATADGQTIVVGNMWDASAQNVTNAQTKTLFATNKDVIALLSGMPSESVPQQMQAPIPPEVREAIKTTEQYNPVVTQHGASPGEKLMADLQSTAGVTVGSTSAPLLLMVMDPNCPHCQATWKGLRDAVFKNALQVRLIPVATPDSDNERAAGQLLRSPDSLNAWDKYVAGDKSQLAGTPTQDQIVALRANHMITDSWHIATTPYMAYRGKDGKIKIVQGEPEKIENVLADLIP